MVAAFQPLMLVSNPEKLALQWLSSAPVMTGLPSIGFLGAVQLVRIGSMPVTHVRGAGHSALQASISQQ